MDTVINTHETANFFVNQACSYSKQVYHNSIFCLLDETIEDNTKNLPTSLRVIEGVKLATIVYIPKLVTFVAISTFGQAAKIPNYSYTVTIGDALILAPAIEEIIFRVIFQNAIQLIQMGMTRAAPDWMKGYTIFQVLTSQKTRVVVITTLFAAIHLTNAPILAANTLALAAVIIIFPSATLAYERGGFEVSWAAHFTNNFFCCFFG